MDLSITIVNTNGISYTLSLLESIFENTHGITFEIILVDNASTDGSCEIIKNRFPQVRMIFNDVVRGFAQNQNAAITKAVGRYVVILNNDMLLSSNAFLGMARFLDSNPAVGAVGPKLVNEDGTFQIGPRGRATPWSWASHELKFDRLFPKSKFLASFFMSYWDPDQSCDMETAMGACIMVRREVLEQVGLLNEHVFFGIDDVEWSLRIRENGWRIHYLSTVSILHYGGATSKHNHSQYMVRSYKGFYWYFLHYGGFWSMNIYRMSVLLGCCMRLAYWSFVFATSSRNRAWAANEMKGRLAVLRLSLSPSLGRLVMIGT